MTTRQPANHTAADVEAYRVLIVDDVAQVRSKVRRTVEELMRGYEFRVDIVEADNAIDALDFVNTNYVDLIVLDLFLDDAVPSGFELVNAMAHGGCCAKVIMITHHDTSSHFDTIMRTVTRIEHPKVVNFLRSEELSRALPDAIRPLLDEFSARSVSVSGLDFAAGLIEKRRQRYPSEQNRLRSTRMEIEVEVQRLCCRLFGLANSARSGTSVSVRLEPLGRRGLSAAVLLRAIVETRVDPSVDRANQFECVLKLGPVEDVRAEAERYEGFVRYGVQLVQRVELLGHSYDQAIGALAYSFAGGVHGESLVTLDELLRTRQDVAQVLIGDLFGSVRWYSVTAKPGEIRQHIEPPESRRRLSDAVERNMKSLSKLGKRELGLAFDWGHERLDSTLRVNGASAIALPGMKFYDSGWAYEEFPRCLVHGDMHGGNVMAELASVAGEVDALNARQAIARVCLIDYRSAGPGPRCIDAVALEGSVRIADTESIAEALGASANELRGDALQAAIAVCARRFDSERDFYAHMLLGRPTRPKAEWASVASTIVEGVRSSFKAPDPEVSPREYIQTVLLYGARQLGYPLDILVRIRLCAWLGAAYSLYSRVSEA